MQTLDYVVLISYFVILIIIGWICSWRIKGQEDFFMGGRGFGKLLQTFAAFGAGTGAQDPINVGRTTWTSGLSGIWSALMWLFITPFYWIFAVWYRRMRLTTLGDWFVERYESKSMGVAYTFMGLTFCVFYLSTMFSAIAKAAEPLLGSQLVLQMVGWIGSDNPSDLKFVLVPTIAVVVIAYGVLGGLAAAYWTDLIQGVCIILLSILLIPSGLQALVDKYGEDPNASAAALEDEAAKAPVPEATGSGPSGTSPSGTSPSGTSPSGTSPSGSAPDATGDKKTDNPASRNSDSKGEWTDGFAIMHKRISKENFQLFGGPRSGEFPLHYIISLSLLGLVGIVVQPHFIATGGGSAKSEYSARVGLVTGNFLKRFCTIGWALTALIVLALLADNVDIAEDPDRAWGVASREILGPFNMGLVGLMLACLLAALMSSADCYMVITSALLVRNIYAPYVNPNASEKAYVRAGRVAGPILVIGATVVSLLLYDVFGQYTLALQIPTIMAAPFWIGMFWRRATKTAAWLTILYTFGVFFVAPIVIPMLTSPLGYESLHTDSRFAVASDRVTTTTTREALAADVAKREAAIGLWDQTKKKADTADAALLAAATQHGAALLAEVEQEQQKDPPPVYDDGSPKQELLVASNQLKAIRGKLKAFGERPSQLVEGESFTETFVTGNKPIFWKKLAPIQDEKGNAPTDLWEVVSEDTSDDGRTQVKIERYKVPLRGDGTFNSDFVLYQLAGLNLRSMDNALLSTLVLPPRLITPFLVMILLSLITPRNSQEALDRYYVKMKTPVDPDPDEDLAELQRSYEDPSRFDNRRLLPGTGLEIQKPTFGDVAGFVISVAICFAFIALAWYVANVGGFDVPT